MSNMQRTKGATGERELSREIEAALGVRLVRNLAQSRAGGHDLVVEPDAAGPAADVLRCLAIEVKRLASVEPHDVARCWGQAVEQGDRAGLWPALAYRGDRRAWRIRLPLAALWPDAFPIWTHPSMTVEVDLLGFAALVRESAQNGQRILVAANLGSTPAMIEAEAMLGAPPRRNLLGGPVGGSKVELAPWQIAWLEA